mmetsp:Transcript_14463/g.41039  ORF Transcript_14463/g.41039 Transcript_14463/m.41039 type:complete len:251 (+) Transcript_14463:713-1465(+)
MGMDPSHRVVALVAREDILFVRRVWSVVSRHPVHGQQGPRMLGVALPPGADEELVHALEHDLVRVELDAPQNPRGDHRAELVEVEGQGATDVSHAVYDDIRQILPLRRRYELHAVDDDDDRSQGEQRRRARQVGGLPLVLRVAGASDVRDERLLQPLGLARCPSQILADELAIEEDLQLRVQVFPLADLRDGMVEDFLRFGVRVPRRGRAALLARPQQGEGRAGGAQRLPGHGRAFAAGRLETDRGGTTA